MTLGERFLGLPRAMQWSVIALVAFLLYFVVLEPALIWKSELDENIAAADIVLTELQEQVKDREADLSSYERGLSRHGEVLPPRPLSEVSSKVFDLWEQISLEFDSVTGLRLQTGEAGFSGDSLPGTLVPPGASLVAVRFTANFEATPEDVIAIVRQLEASPLIHSVSSLRIRLNTADERMLSAQIETESWAHSGEVGAL